jgi:hypothetical protein
MLVVIYMFFTLVTTNWGFVGGPQMDLIFVMGYTAI